MKKYFICLVILVSIFLAPKVSASSYNLSMNSSQFTNSMIATDDYIKSFSYVNVDIFNHFQSALENRIDTTTYDYVVQFYSYKPYSSSYVSHSFAVLYFPKGQNVDFYYNLVYETGYDSYGNLHFWVKTFENVNYGVLIYNLINNSNYTFTTSTNYTNGKVGFSAGQFFRTGYNATFGKNALSVSKDSEQRLYKSTIPLKFSSIDSNYINNLTVYDNSNNNETFVLNSTSDYGITFLNSDLELDFLTPPAPNFNFQITDNYDSFNHKISVNINMTIDNYNADYVYQYQKGGTSGTWTSLAIEENNGIYYYNWNNWSENTNIYFRAMDPNTHEMVSSATLQIADITSFITLNISNATDFSNCSSFNSSNITGLILIPKATEQQSTLYFSVPTDFTLPNNVYKFGYSMKYQTLSNVEYFTIQALLNQNSTNMYFNNVTTFTDYFSSDNYNIYYFEPLEYTFDDGSAYCSSLTTNIFKPLTITFDSSIYNYEIITSEDNDLSIVDPNTGKTIDLNSISNNSNIGGFTNSVKDFITEMRQYISIPYELLSYFISKLNSPILMTIITIFTILVVLALVRIIRR